MLDVPFIEAHTHGFEKFEAKVRSTSWDDIEIASGLDARAIEAAAQVYVEADRVIGIYGMGLTQQVNGFDNIAMFVNLLMLKGNIGRDGTGISPVRGHSNVQGQRTVGISEKPELVPLDKYAKQFGFEPPREKGMNTVEACEGILAGTVKAFFGLGGNFVRAIPEREKMESGMGQDGPDGPDRHQAQPQPSREWQISLPASVPGPNRTGHAGQWSASCHDGGHLQLHQGSIGGASRRASTCGPNSRSSLGWLWPPYRQIRRSSGNSGSATMH